MDNSRMKGIKRHFASWDERHQKLFGLRYETGIRLPKYPDVSRSFLNLQNGDVVL